MFRGQHKIIPQHSRSKSSTKPPSPFLTCQFKMATRPLLFSRHPIPWVIAKYTPCEPYTTYFDRPTGRPSCHDCSNSTSSVKKQTNRASFETSLLHFSILVLWSINVSLLIWHLVAFRPYSTALRHVDQAPEIHKICNVSP